MTIVDDIKAQLDLVDIVSQTVKLRKAGKNYSGFCPFHANTHTPAFVVFPETQTWRCFGQCNTGGDLIGYVMKREGWDFGETLKYLADKAGITLPSYTPVNEKAEEVKQSIVQLLQDAADYYRQQMIETSQGQEALAYLRKRGLNDETIKIWGLGYAPGGWNELTNAMKRKGYTDVLLLEAGLVIEREDGGTYDKFRHRLMFPIRDTSGKMAGFGGRVLDPNDVPKYMNSPKTELFDKGRLLYGLDLTRQAIRSEEKAVIVEGYMDVIGLYQAGFKNAVSPMGTALTEDQFRLLKKFSHNLVLALDPDAAGEKATLKGLETARKTMDQDSEMTYDARGLLRVESRLNADIRVTTLPDGRDPDEIALADPEAWRVILVQAKPVVVHVMESLARGQNLDDAKVKREIAGQIVPLIEDVTDPVEREAYRQSLARMLKIDERALPVTSGTGQKPTRRNSQNLAIPSRERMSTPAQRNRKLERVVLKALARDPEALYKVDRGLAKLSIPALSEKDFTESDLLIAFQIIKTALQQDEISAEEFVRENLPDDLDLFEQEIQTLEGLRQVSDAKRLEEIIRNVLRIRRNLVEHRINEIVYLQSEAMEGKLYSDEEAHFLILEQLNQRRLIDVALELPEAGGNGRPIQTIKGTTRVRK
ncbi:MAG: DNA primase [Anaerolineaceae bacterium]